MRSPLRILKRVVHFFEIIILTVKPGATLVLFASPDIVTSTTTRPTPPCRRPRRISAADPVDASHELLRKPPGHGWHSSYRGEKGHASGETFVVLLCIYFQSHCDNHGTPAPLFIPLAPPSLIAVLLPLDGSIRSFVLPVVFSAAPKCRRRGRTAVAAPGEDRAAPHGGGGGTTDFNAP